MKDFSGFEDSGLCADLSKVPFAADRTRLLCGVDDGKSFLGYVAGPEF